MLIPMFGIDFRLCWCPCHPVLVPRLELIKKQQHARAEAHKASEEAKKSTMAQLEAPLLSLDAYCMSRHGHHGPWCNHFG